jgi:hypothetical protein
MVLGLNSLLLKIKEFLASMRLYTILLNKRIEFDGTPK